MTDNEIIIAVAKLDGWTGVQYNSSESFSTSGIIGIFPSSNTGRFEIVPPYLTSRDAIIPVIKKHRGYHGRIAWSLCISNENADEKESWTIEDCITILTATPKQLCIALLKATGKWEE